MSDEIKKTCLSKRVNYPTYSLATKTTIIDEDTGTLVKKDFAMSSPAGVKVMNPITSLIQLEIASAKKAGKILSLADAMATVATTLGISGDDAKKLLEDYLTPENKASDFGKRIHAMARNIATQLPATTAGLNVSENANLLADLNKVVKTIAAAVDKAISEGKDPAIITIIINDDGTATTYAPSLSDAKEFMAEVRYWGTELSQKGDTFSDKIDVASALIDGKSDALISVFSDILLKIESTSSQNQIDLTAADLYPGATGSFVGKDNGTDSTIDFSAVGDLTIAGERYVFNITSSGAKGAGSATSQATLDIDATLTSEAVELKITKGKATVKGVVAKTDTTAADISAAIVEFKLPVMIVAKAAPATEFVGEVSLSLAPVTDKKDTFELNFSLDGKFSQASESFSAKVGFSTLRMIESVDNIDESDVTVSTMSLEFDAKLTDFTGKVNLMFDQKSKEAGAFTANLMSDKATTDVKFMFASGEPTGIISASNEAGVLLAVTLTDLENSDDVGSIHVGIKKFATISVVKGLHKITYTDGSFETLF